ncbi:protein phosphatase 1 regulatory subunit 14A isoform X2 [Monodon monoceros]|uniref:protein phosphatase 1 regulatory subunit 14A isoform X2 n=1 Tax=Monodon monoceros TaxID=40151 RepID=UPI0010F8FC8B|nr:protein phosphatase 1 regulatory subunit 14A isoform X2 [Monodon monoceros]
MAAQRLGKRVLSKLQAPSRARGPGGSPGGLRKRHARVTVKYDRRELQRRLDVEKWIDGRLEELYCGREADMPDEVNIDELLELESEEERSRKIQGGAGPLAPYSRHPWPARCPLGTLNHRRSGQKQRVRSTHTEEEVM